MANKPEFMTWDEVFEFCESHRDRDRFCEISCACSGPCYSNLFCDSEERRELAFNRDEHILRGGSYGSCKFYVKD